MALVRKSPYQTTLAPVISLVPKRTGISLPSSAVGTEKSDRPEDATPGGLGRNRNDKIAIPAEMPKDTAAGINQAGIRMGFLQKGFESECKTNRQNSEGC